MTEAAGRARAGAAATIHATALVVHDRGVLIRGPSGSGKSTLARRLLDRAGREGRFARLVADDRVVLRAAGGRLIARPAPAIAGRLEIRGIGIVRVPAEPACRVHLVVDLVAEAPRLPDGEARGVELAGVRLPRLAARPADAEELAMWRIRGADDTPMTEG